MFDNLKKMYELKKMQDEFKKETITVGKNGTSITMNGNFEVTDITLNAELTLSEQQMALKQAFNQARESIQKTLAQKMMASGFSL